MTSLQFIALLVISELAQDLCVHLILVEEILLPSGARTLSKDGRQFLDEKLYPPVFSLSAFADVAIPLLASTCLTGVFAWTTPKLAPGVGAGDKGPQFQFNCSG